MAEACLRKLQHKSSRPPVFCEKGVLKNFAILTGKHLFLESLLNKFIGLQPHSYFPTSVKQMSYFKLKTHLKRAL